MTGPETVAQVEAWVREEVEPHSNAWEESQELPAPILERFAEAGWFGAALSPRWGGLGLTGPELGRFCAALAKGSVSLLSLFTVHNMVIQALVGWGREDQKEHWLPRLAKGQPRAAFALTEPERGSDAANLLCRVTPEDGHYVITGEKKWISGSAGAGLFLVMAKDEAQGLGAFLTPGETPGLSRRPMKDLFGFRAAGICELTLDGCRVPESALLGRLGAGFTFVAAQALDWGRFTVAWGAVGLMEACLEASVAYARERRQFDQPLRKHQLIQALIADMATDLAAGRALAAEAARQRDEMSPDSIMTTSAAKYFCSRAALKAAENALQIHGGNGCGPDYPLGRYLRDAKICEIIEGSNQMQQLMIAADAFRGAARRGKEPRR